MDLKLRDVADLLNVSENTVRRWVSEGKIPYYRLSNQFRFSRSEIEDWLLTWQPSEEGIAPFAQGEQEGMAERLGTQQFGLFRAVHKGGAYRQVPGKTKEEVIRNAVDRLASDLKLDAGVIADLLLDRERLMPTSLSRGIGVPHTRDFLLPESYDVVSVIFPEQPIEYGALDGQPVHTLFFLFACDDKRHLHLLAKLAHFCSKEEHLEFLQTHPEKTALLEHIRSWEATLKLGAPRDLASL